ncbi:hypothetical protein OW763_01725 [Clostridium aestuarii]|uniref:Glycoside hydrolase family 65 C-terminal domain-containing protein n=1 Tax=Clostridium aestuarii TaxID=338193 RepID=A0ABT4CW83_9CLOT|nr:hypothetical protein [Clostridium aestuarii]
MNFKGCLIQVEVNKKAVKYTLIKGEKIEIYHKNIKFSLVVGDESSRDDVLG